MVHPSILQMLLAIFFLNTAVQATWVLPVERTTGLGCIPVDRTVSYRCTVDDDGGRSTIWRGSALNCTSSASTIILPHVLFSGPGETTSCGDLSAMAVGVSGSNYTSRVTLTATTALNGRTVECARTPSVIFGNDTIRIGAPPPSPQSAMVNIISTSSLTVSWISPSDATNVGGYMFTVTGDCGDCEDTTFNSSSRSASCSGWTASGQTCSFEVRTVSQDCGFSSTATLTSVVLSAPLPPSDINLMYSQDTCMFQSAVLSWMAPSLPTGYPPVRMYSVRVDNEIAMSTSGNVTTLTVPSSTFSRAGTYMFSVAAVNALGEGVALAAGFNVSLTNVSSSYTAEMTNATLKFSLSNTVCNSTASIIVYYQECSNQRSQDTSFSTNEQSTSAALAELLMITGLIPGVTYCYRSEVVYAGSIVGFENGRMFTTVRPIPPPFLLGARLLSSDTLMYECLNSVEGFNGGSSQITASFDPVTLYSVPPCSIFVWLIVLIVILVIVLIVGVIFGVILTIYLVKKHKEKADDDQDITEKTLPPPDSLYADPNTIEHEAAPGTEDQYAMVDRKVKKNTKPKPAPPEALYQDPNTIEHETAASGDTYAVVDKPKRSSKKKGGPDVVPPASEGLTYADIDLSSKRPKPGSGRQAPQQPGEYPKEHPVEYSSVDHGNTSQL